MFARNRLPLGSGEVASAQDRYLRQVATAAKQYKNNVKVWLSFRFIAEYLTAQKLRREIPPSMLGTYNHYFSSRLPFPVVAIFAKYKII